jgi:hypothetical protein
MRIKKTILVALVLAVVSLNAQTDSSATNSGDSLLNTKVVPTFTTSLDLLEEETESQDVSGLLQSSKDVFTNIAGFNFGAARYRVRGYDSENYTVMMNGVTLNSPEGGRAIWAFWGGLNDITRYQNAKSGINASSLTFGGIGGFSNISARATAIRTGTKISYAYSNRSYNHRLMVTHATGMMKNGWAIAVSGSGRYSDEGYIDGTFYQAASYFLSVEKKLNNKHSLGFVAFGAPTVQGRSSISTQEAYDLTGNNYYNSYWGLQAGEKRNSRVRNNHKPRIMLNHYFDINTKTKLNSSLYYTFGRGGSTRLNWNNAADPRPDYYKNLPSYFNDPNQTTEFASATTAWQSGDPTVTQLDWDQMYFANSKNLFTQTSVDGIVGNDKTFNRAKYIVEEQRQDASHYGFTTSLTHQLKDNMMLSGGATVSIYKSENFKVINDLLGADFWVDVDQFAERDFADESAAQADVNNPNRLVKEGDRFGYDYDININTYSGFGQVEGTSKKVDWFAGFSVVSTSFWRTGKMKNGLFPDNSEGNSETQSFFNYGVKAGAVYKLTGRHLIRANAAFITRAPFSRTAYISPRTRNEVIPNLKSEKITTGDLSYIARFSKVKARATIFYTTIKDKTWNRSFYHEDLNTFINYSMTGVNQSFAGVEFGLEANITSTLIATAAFATGEFIYDSRPSVTITQDNSTELLESDKTVYFKGFKIGGIPQTAGSIGLQYRSPKYWFVGTNFNYFTDIYLDANPDRRTEEALAPYVSTDPQVAQIVDQTKLDDDYTLNLFAGKSWKIKEYYIRFNINVNNVLNNKDFQTGGFEQLRYDAAEINKFPPKVGYMLGRTYFAMVSFSF